MRAAGKNSTVIFFGSPDFAIPSLKSLISSEYRPALVVTQPDRPAGRGKKPSPTPVRRTAEENGLPVTVVGTFADDNAIDSLRSLKPDFFVVVAFGLIFPRRMLEIAAKANINLHASLLPAYRGASPINMAIVKGECYTGVTTMEMTRELDAGPIYLQKKIEIDPMENAGELSERLASAGAGLLLETLRSVDKEHLAPREQPGDGISFAPRLKKQDGLIRWEESAGSVLNHIRGMNPWPGSFTYHEGNYLKIHRAERAGEKVVEVSPGTVVRAGADGIIVACGEGSLRIVRLQAPGRRPLEVEAFLRGYGIDPGDTLGGEDGR
jgi:methionyl-tRNA formyltransferase